MKKYFQKISFRIWFPFASALAVLMILALWYYPSQQEKLFRENKENQLNELAKTVALGVELSLKSNDFEGLKKTVDFVSGTTEFEFVAILVEDSVDQKKSVFISYPEMEADSILERNEDLHVYESYPFSAPDFKGEILIAASKARINQLVQDLNRPVYILLPFVLLISLILFFALARRISQPIESLTKAAKELENENYTVAIERTTQQDEIGELRNAFSSLKDSLVEQKERNRLLNLGLEDQIKERTADLQEAQVKLLEAQKVAKIGHYEYFFKTDHWESSNELNQILGVDAHFKFTLMGWNELVVEEDREYMMGYYLDLISQKKPFQQDYRIKRPSDGEIRWISGLGQIKSDANGSAVSFAGTMQDITERKLAEEEIKKLSLVARYTSSCVVITDVNRRITWVNDSLIKLSGYTYEEIIGNTPKMFQFEKTDPKTKEYISEKLSKHESVNAEILNRGKHGNEYWLDLNIVPILNEKNELNGYIAVEGDITDRKKASEDLQKSQEQLKRINETLEQKVLENTKKNLDLSKSIVEQEKLATIGEISAGIAHDLNTPLGAIKVGTESVMFTFEGLMQHLVSKCTDEQRLYALDFSKSRKVEIYVGGLQLIRERKEMLIYLERNFGAARADLNSIAELLVKCRISSEETEVIDKILSYDNASDLLELIYNIQIIGSLLDTIKTSVDKASKVVKDIRSFIKTETSIDRSRINLHDNIQTVLSIFNYELKRNIQLVFDVDQRIQIDGYDIKLFQLWSNLIKNAIDAMDGMEERKLIVRSELHDRMVDIIIENVGPEIPEDIIDKIFKKFFTTKQAKGGTGLGLSIVKNVADEHGAKIQVKSGNGRTRFTISFRDPYLM